MENHAHTHHDSSAAGPQKEFSPRALSEATRNPVLSSPGVKPAGTSPEGVKLPKEWLLTRSCRIWRTVKHDGDSKPKFKVPGSL